MGLGGLGRRFWRTAVGLPRPQDRKNVRRLPATVLEVSGAAPNQSARVLLPGEEATERPFFPVRGSVAVGESCFAEVNASGLVVVGNAAGGGASGPITTAPKNAAAPLSEYPAGSSLMAVDGTVSGWPAASALVVTHHLSAGRNRQIVHAAASLDRWERLWNPNKAGGAGWEAFSDGKAATAGFVDVSGDGGANVALPDGSPQKVPVANEAADDAGWFAGGAYRPQVAGNYAFNFMAPIGGLTDQTRAVLRLNKNGAFFTTLTNLPMSGSGAMNVSASFATPANGTTDFFELYAMTVGGPGTLVMGPGTRFQAWRLPVRA